MLRCLGAGCGRWLAWGALFTSCSVAAAEPKRIHIACDDHTDYFWTADPATYRRALVETLDEFERVAREKSSASRRVIVSNEMDFFRDFEATYGARLPSLSVSFGNDWDLYPATLAEGAVLENEFYRVTVGERGAITSLVDKSGNSRECVRPGDGKAMNDLGPSEGVLEFEQGRP